MIQLLLFTLLIGCSQVANGHKSEGILNSRAIVNEINSMKSITWKADTYGTTEIDFNKFIKTRLGLKLTRPVPKGSTVAEIEKSNIVEPPIGFEMPASDNLPTNFTWANKKLTDCPIGNIRDQSNCGSCWAVSSVAVLGDRLCLKTKGKFKQPLSANHITACDDKNYGCFGGFMNYVYDFFKYNGAITGGDYDSDEGCQPYSIAPCDWNGETKLFCTSDYANTPKCRNTKCTNDWYKDKYEKKTFKISEYHQVGSPNDDYSIRKEIYENGPVVATFHVYQDFLYYKSGIYEHKWGFWPGGHAVRVVGWGEENGVKYWTVANSWGYDWGENGYFRIKRGVNMCTIESDMTAMTPIVD